MRINRIFILSAIFIMLLSGCGNKDNSSFNDNDNNTLTYYFIHSNGIKEVSGSFNNTPFAKHLNKKTGINVEYIVPEGNINEHLKILASIDELPDIIELTWKSYPGGPEKAVSDGIIIELNDVLKGYAPNLSNYLKDHRTVDKNVSSDEGIYYYFPFSREDEKMNTFQGPFVRKDWLDKCNLDIPVTIDDWTVMLEVFKEKIGAEAPLTIGKDIEGSKIVFSGAYGVTNSFYVDDGVVKYGPAEPGYYEYIKLFRYWYSKGLLDSFYPNATISSVEINILNGKSGATVQSVGSGMGKWIGMINDDSGFELEGTPYPVLNVGDRPKFAQYEWKQIGAAISTGCTNIPLAAKFLDYGYSEEGQLLYNFGIEGNSYSMVSGKPVYTDLVIKNPTYPVATIMSNYIRGNSSGPFVQMKDYLMQYYSLPQQRDAYKMWSDTDVKYHALPPINFSGAEIKEMSSLSSKISRYSDDWYYKLIMGLEPIEKYGEFQNGLKELNIDRLLEIYQQAYDRYNLR